ncbi:hypothetical protein Hanom_Chr06g00531831 [Helianthus anomalus]
MSTPPQQTKNVEDPGSTTKKTTTLTPQSSSRSFSEMPSNLGPGLTSLEDVGFFGDQRVDGIVKRVTVLEKEKVVT